jgi:hypothetical protein
MGVFQYGTWIQPCKLGGGGLLGELKCYVDNPQKLFWSILIGLISVVVFVHAYEKGFSFFFFKTTSSLQ